MRAVRAARLASLLLAALPAGAESAEAPPIRTPKQQLA